MSRPDHDNRVVINETYRLTEGLANAAFKSPLAGLRNRAALALLADEHDRNVTPRFAVAYADLTGFKAINESHGHAAGDATIKQFGGLLNDICDRIEGYAYHLSGDEFVALIPPDRVADFCVAAGSIQRFDVAFPDGPIHAQAHFGIALPYEAGVIDELQRRAEKACGTAKTSRRGEPLIWTGAEQETQIISKRWRCESCQATIQILVPVSMHRDLPFVCANCHAPVPGEPIQTPKVSTDVGAGIDSGD